MNPAASDPGPEPYAHWMLREIYEQPSTLAATLARYVEHAAFRHDICEPARRWLRAAGGQIVIAASGSSRHAAMLAELMMEQASDIAVDVEYASEYLYSTGRTRNKAALMVVSQSGETADTLAVLRKGIDAGLETLAVTNVAESTMAREVTVSFPTEAGRERAVPATKSFTAQVLNLYLLALLAAEVRGGLTEAQIAAQLTALAQLPALVEQQLPAWDRAVRDLTARYREVASFLFLGRGLHYPVAREGALKLKESAYIHAEGYPSGELKHGPNALLGEGTALVMLATRDDHDGESVVRYGKVLQLMRDMRAQGASILAVANAGDDEVAALADDVVTILPAPEPLSCLCEVVPLQLFAYHMAVAHGIDVDHPRNLTKAVLAE